MSMFHFASLAAVLILSPSVGADEPANGSKGPPAAELLANGLAAAKKDGKQVFLIFGSPTCGWCKYFDKFHTDAEVARIVGKYFVLVKVDIVTNPGGEEMYKKYGSDRGVPAWTLLNPDGKGIGDSGDGRDNVGFPYEEKEVAHYLKAIRAAAPKLTEAEVDLLMRKLAQVGPKKEKKDK